MEEAETRIVCLEEASERLLSDDVKRGKLMDAMWDRIQSLENHSKRNNVRLIGLRETFGTNGTLLSCVQRILREGLGVSADAGFEIERAHRLLSPMPDPDRPPRPVIVRFLRQSARDRVITAAREKRGLEWERMSTFSISRFD